jgi:hypothetical protein
VIYSAADGLDMNLVGQKAKAADVTIVKAADVVKFTTSPAVPFISPKDSNTGLLGTIPTTFYFPFSAISSTGVSGAKLIPVPYFNKTDTPNGSNDLDDYISSVLKQAILDIAKIDKTGLLGGGTNTTAQRII